MRLFGLLGQNLNHSLSENYFETKFKKEGVSDCKYQNFEIPRINDLPALIKDNKDLVGLNVTIPYKELVLPFLDEVSPEAEIIGAVNTIQIKNGKTIGYNTDFLGFEQSLLTFLKGNIRRALILGSGGAAKAVAFGLRRLGISYQFVSRRKIDGSITYDQVISELILPNLLIINCTPLGTYPKVDDLPPIPKSFLNNSHFIYDLVYNPEETALMKLGKSKGCNVKNGLEMLQNQAEASWEIWNS